MARVLNYMRADGELPCQEKQQRMASGPCAGQQISVYRPTRTAAIFSHYGLAQHLTPFLHQGPRDIIRAATRRVRHNQADRPIGPSRLWKREIRHHQATE